jgi:hypothetical protein
MGYNLHSERDERPISLEEWRAYVTADPEMRLEQELAPWVPAGETIKDGLAGWMNHPALKDKGEPYFFHFWTKSIVVRSPDDDLVEKMKRIAGTLNAVVRGDEGEEY